MQTPSFTVILRNGTIVDGSGRGGFVADLALQGDRLAQIR